MYASPRHTNVITHHQNSSWISFSLMLKCLNLVCYFNLNIIGSEMALYRQHFKCSANERQHYFETLLWFKILDIISDFYHKLCNHHVCQHVANLIISSYIVLNCSVLSAPFSNLTNCECQHRRHNGLSITHVITNVYGWLICALHCCQLPSVWKVSLCNYAIRQ